MLEVVNAMKDEGKRKKDRECWDGEVGIAI